MLIFAIPVEQFEFFKIVLFTQIVIIQIARLETELFLFFYLVQSSARDKELDKARLLS